MTTINAQPRNLLIACLLELLEDKIKKARRAGVVGL
jgi:hypothetical protein